ncbi:hypothetical protein [Streptomyces melanogenes]|uniref:hypothetical protein n=1 Tax=Streptomyces melanogenes TaxID=67326 RepID=UPI00167EDA62|nr:hypothetical protein [Streptomyces melanogenes]
MRSKRSLAIIALGAVCSLGLASAPWAQASEAGVQTCDVFTTDKYPEGYGDGRVCDGNITGTVHDTRADGRCPYVRIFFDDGGWWESPWAGGKGKVTYFSGYHTGRRTSAVLDYISC